MEKEIYTLKVYNTLTKQYEDVVVTKKVYDTYRRTEWNIKDNDESFYDHEIQMSGLIGGEDNGYENFREFVDEEDTPENIVMEQSLIEKLHQVIEELTDHEAALIRALYFDGVTETDYAKQIGVSIAYVCKLNKKILRKIQKSFQ